MRKNYRISLITGLLILLCGCTSDPFYTDSDSGNIGLKYYLPTSRVTFNLYKVKDIDEKYFGPFYEIQFGETRYFSDNSTGRFLRYNPDIFSDDHLCIERTDTGLLKAVKLASSDRTGDILIKLAETATLLATGVPVPSEKESYGLKYLAPISETSLPRLLGFLGENKDLVYTGLFDPYNFSEIEAAENSLVARLKPKYRELVSDILIKPVIKEFIDNNLENKLSELKNENGKLPKEKRKSEEELKNIAGNQLEKKAEEFIKSQNNLKNSLDDEVESLKINFSLSGLSNKATIIPDTVDGKTIYYRTKINIPISVAASAKDYNLPLYDQNIDVIDKKNIESIEIDRAKFIHKVTDLRFDNGVLTGVNIQHPSQGLAVASLPLKMASAILEVPAAFFTAITRSLQSESNVINAKANLIKSMAEYNKTIKQETSTTSQGTVINKPNLGVTPTQPASFKDDSIKCFQ